MGVELRTTMSQLLSDQRAFLELYMKAGLKQRKVLLQTLSDAQLRALSEIVHNVLKGNVPLSSDQERTLRKYRPVLYVLGDNRLKPAQKKKSIRKSHFVRVKNSIRSRAMGTKSVLIPYDKYKRMLDSNHDSKSVPCIFCKDVFSRKDVLLRHVRNKHMDEVVPSSKKVSRRSPEPSRRVYIQRSSPPRKRKSRSPEPPNNPKSSPSSPQRRKCGLPEPPSNVHKQRSSPPSPFSFDVNKLFVYFFH